MIWVTPANDLMNVSFVFIVEGKQDKSRLPLLLKKYYSEVYDESGQLKRIAIISTNSCTNIKTYANLKYINSVYLKESLMMIRDSDGKNRMQLGQQLCKYYGDRSHEDKGNLPRVTEKKCADFKICIRLRVIFCFRESHGAAWCCQRVSMRFTTFCGVNIRNISIN